jgi:hypothetical protein
MSENDGNWYRHEALLTFTQLAHHITGPLHRLAVAFMLRALRKGATFAARGGQFSGWAMGRGMQPLAAGADRG